MLYADTIAGHSELMVEQASSNVHKKRNSNIKEAFKSEQDRIKMHGKKGNDDDTSGSIRNSRSGLMILSPKNFKNALADYMTDVNSTT